MDQTSSGGLNARISALIKLKPGEGKPLVWSFLYFFSLLCSYYILRPIRDEMGIQAGVRNLQWIFMATFAAMLIAVPIFGWAVKRFQRIKLVPVVYFFFIANLVLFYILFNTSLSKVWLGRAFFIWVSVFNLFVISIFWSFMADIFNGEQAGRLFGVIAAGGSAGAITGPALTAVLSTTLGPVHIIPISMGFLLLALVCVQFLAADVKKRISEGKQTSHGDHDRDYQAPIGGGIFSGAVRVAKSPYLMGIVLFVFLFTTLSTFLYFEQAHIVKDAFDSPAERTRVFAAMDLAVNVLTVLCQIFFTSRIVTRFGLSAALAIIPVLVGIGFFVIGLFPVLAVLLTIQIIRRAGNYALTRPAREMLYTAVSPEDKYKSKNFIDTVVYRGGDAASGWAFAGLKALGLSISTIAFIAVPLAALWALVGYLLGKKKEALGEDANFRDE